MRVKPHDFQRVSYNEVAHLCVVLITQHERQYKPTAVGPYLVMREPPHGDLARHPNVYTSGASIHTNALDFSCTKLWFFNFSTGLYIWEKGFVWRYHLWERAAFWNHMCHHGHNTNVLGEGPESSRKGHLKGFYINHNELHSCRTGSFMLFYINCSKRIGLQLPMRAFARLKKASLLSTMIGTWWLCELSCRCPWVQA